MLLLTALAECSFPDCSRSSCSLPGCSRPERLIMLWGWLLTPRLLTP
jgi:hypothetical protein